jgi:hypothetical protein
LVAHAVAFLLRGRPVVAQAVGLDDETQGGPIEVDLEPVDPRSRLRHPEPRSSRNRQESTLELGLREPERAPVQELTKSANPGLRAEAFERVAQPFRIDQVELVGLVHCPLERAASDARREVDKCAGDVGHGDAISRIDVLGQHPDPAVCADTTPAPDEMQRERDVDHARAVRDDAP